MRPFLFLIAVPIIFLGCNSNKALENAQIKAKTMRAISDPTVFVGKHQAQAMILGVFHFDNPGLDSYQENYTVDILKDQRQAELEKIIEKLRKFNPTKILVESRRIERDSILNVEYNNFLMGQFEIEDKANEIYQIGFRLAKELGHNYIFASDVSNSPWFGADLDWDKFDKDEYLKSLGQIEKATRYDFERKYELEDSLKSVLSLLDYFRLINEPSNRLKDHQAYLTALVGGAGDLYISADGIARWYQRNLRIFSNVYDIADFSQEDRILMIYGAGHVWQLRQLFIDSPDFEYVEVNDYL